MWTSYGNRTRISCHSMGTDCVKLIPRSNCLMFAALYYL